MTKSRETYSKKEKEKKKQQKKQAKAEKKEERKANAKSDFEDMLAYVDENGNISSTPPDPKQKKKVKLEDIVIGVPKQEELDEADTERRGTVTFYNDSKKFGFIRDHETQESIFVHINACKDDIAENDKVTFQTEKTPKGLSAVDVKLAK